MAIIRSSAVSHNRNIPYSFYNHEVKSTDLAIILPGLDYTSQAPLLHYTTKALFSRGIDVLQANYHYSEEVLASLSEEDITQDVSTVIDEILIENQYTKFYFVAKSIGTIPMAHLLKSPSFHSAKSIWLTPLWQRDDVYHSLLNNKEKALCIIGDQDPNYNSEKVEMLQKNPHLQLEIIKDTNHSLEFEDNVIESIKVVTSVTQKVIEF